VTAIAGLGDWTANYIALRLGERDAFPANDLGLRRALAGYAEGTPVELAERWRPWRALAATQLWSASAAPLDLARGAA
jgi:AraC family transcriptional regulator of adaptative response / DNA-3-methyladenine glycosylase II